MNQAAIPTITLPRSAGRDWRLALVIVLAVALAIMFWSGSRYPALQEKALMGGDTPLSGLSFDVAIEVVPGASFLSVLWANTINWIVTNLKGMTFGVLFGAMALTLLSLVQKRSFRNGFANSALGVAIGAPLGVCVNCAVPIALGLHAGRLRLETTLSAMLASPTLNVIVVTMSFALLPVHVAAVKLFASLMMVLVGVPLLCRFLLKAETEATRDARAASAVNEKLGGLSGWLMRHLSPREFEAGAYGPLAALVWFVRTYGRNFLYVFIVTVPMMFLAALLGALFVELFSPTALIGVLPRSNLLMLFLGMVLVALFLSFAPAPISLDVILTAVLLGLGMSDNYAATTVIALGSFSVYAFIVIGRAISWRTALALWGMVVAAAVCAGLLAHVLAAPAREYRLDGYRAIMATSPPITFPEAPDTEVQVSLADLRPLLAAQAVVPQVLAFAQEGERVAGVSLLPVAPVAASTSGPVFSRLVGRDIGIGISEPIHAMPRLFFHQWEGGVAAGDIHGDGWTDVVLRKSFLSGGLAIYANIGGQFVRQQADLGPVDSAQVHSVALADMDGDGALDLFVATQDHGNHLFWNRDGGFSAADSVKLPGDDRAITQSVAFADFDRDGVLDIALGNAGLGISAPGFGRFSADSQANALLLNRGLGVFEARPFDAYGGQTLTLLASDFDRNGTIDLLAGNDLANTDQFALFAPDGSFTVARRDTVPFPFRLRTSMSYDEGDYNNDLIPDYYGGQVANGGSITRSAQARITNLTTLCTQMAADSRWDEARRDDCVARLNAISQLKGGYQTGLQSGCEDMRDASLRSQCAARALIQSYVAERTPAPDTATHARCLREMRGNVRFEAMCDSLLLALTPLPSNDALDEELGPTYTQRNILLTGRSAGGFSEDAAPLGVDRPGWTWDARFTDLDQDGWQDLLVMTGYWAMAPEDDRNVLYRNQQGRFVEAGAEFGLDDPLPSLSAARLDFDRDGDVDLIRALSGPNVIAHRNTRPRGPGLWVHLRQPGGNRMAVGARVTICVDGEVQVRPGRCQTRAVRASGGFQSFDPIAAHFGLGEAREVSLVAVTWPDGSSSMIRPQALAGGEVVVTRAQ